jgi:hypothetical protein
MAPSLPWPRSDIDYWTISNSDPEFGLALGFGGLALAGLSLAVKPSAEPDDQGTIQVPV